jgi:GTP cyclohydrolase IB
MKDIQNTIGDFKYMINKVGVCNLIHPIRVQEDENISNTVGTFSLNVSLDKNLKGINMSRLPIVLTEVYNDNLIFSSYKIQVRDILEDIRKRMDSKDAFFEVDFDYFFNKKSPVSKYEGLMSVKCNFNGSLIETDQMEDAYDFILTIEVPITTLCPCSKEISSYSAHNQRGYVNVSLKYNSLFFIKDIVKVIEDSASSEVFPILKRIDEKYVTEKAYENPRFVEDIVRLIADNLYHDERIEWFKISSRHLESIHPHDAIATIEIDKKIIIL